MLQAHEYQAALNAAPDAILIVDPGGKIKFASERVRTVFGYSPEELLESSIDRLVPANYRAAHASRRAAFVHSPSARAMGSVVGLFGQRKDGSSVAVEISLAPVETEKGLRVICAVRDAALQQSELLRLFMANMPGAAAMLDTRMRYVAVTKAWMSGGGLVSCSRDLGENEDSSDYSRRRAPGLNLPVEPLRTPIGTNEGIFGRLKGFSLKGPLMDFAPTLRDLRKDFVVASPEYVSVTEAADMNHPGFVGIKTG